jgi:hypothetical protein
MSVDRGYGAPTTINEVRTLAVETVVGTFVGFGEAQWNTPGGLRPTRDEFQSKPARLYRPISFDVATVVLGTSDPATFSIHGGSLGCDSITYDDGIVLEKGSTYLAIFMPIDDSEGKPSGRLNLLAAWPVDADGTVHTAADGDLSLDDVTAGLVGGIKATPPPSPGEKSPTGP